jgi:putative ABC transport system ATP-binding protein
MKLSSLSHEKLAAVTLNRVTKHYPGPPPLTALSSVTLAIDSGKHTVIMGPSGSGKSTLANIIGAIDSATSGEVLVHGYDLSAAGERERAWFRRTSIGFVFQSSHLLPERSVVENVELALLIRDGRRRRGHRALAREALSSVGLDSRWQADPRHLSGGERQRAAIARALVTEPALIVMDEPTGNLDSSSTDRVLDVVRRVVEREITVITVTHDPTVKASGDAVISMRDGRLTSDAGQVE